MIAIASQTAPITPHDQFLTMLPKIREDARFAFRRLSPDVREELICEVIANAFSAFARLVRQGREDLAYATPLAQFAIRQVRAGRRVGQRVNVRDITSPAAPVGRRVAIERLDRFDTKRNEWREVLVEDKKAGPAETAAARIDFAAWMRRLSRRDRRIAKTLARGESTSATARLFKLSPARVSQLRRELYSSWLAMHGELATCTAAS